MRYFDRGRWRALGLNRRWPIGEEGDSVRNERVFHKSNLLGGGAYGNVALKTILRI